MLRDNITCIGLAALLGMTPAGHCGEPGVPGPAAVQSAPHELLRPPGPAVAQATSCASECQTQHDRCRVQTKGSPSCDAERQRCLEICLQRKKR